MRIEIRGGAADRPARGKEVYLDAKTILSYLLGTDERIDTLVKCKPGELTLMTSDQSLYEALGSLQNYDDFNVRNLIKFLEVVDVLSFRFDMKKRRKILTHERVEELRKAALHSKDSGQK